MKRTFLNFIFITAFGFSPIFAQADKEKTEDSYAKALEYSYSGDYLKAKEILEQILTEVNKPEVAETLVEIYFNYIKQLITNKDTNTIETLYPEIRGGLVNLIKNSPSEALFRNSLKAASLMSDSELYLTLAAAYLQYDSENVIANGIIALIYSQNFYENSAAVMQLYSKVARAIPADQEEAVFVLEARNTLGIAYQMQGQSRDALKYLRLASILRNSPQLPLGHVEAFHLNFPFALVQLGDLDASQLTEDALYILLGSLLAEGSPASLKKLDAILSSKRELSPYEEALSLYRRGISQRAVSVLSNSITPSFAAEFPWFYLDLFYKFFTRLDDKKMLVTAAESMSRYAYKVGQNSLAMSYIANISNLKEEKNKMSYLTGLIHFKQKKYDEAKTEFLSYLKIPNASYKKTSLRTLIEIAILQEDYQNAEKYVVQYQSLNAALSLTKNTNDTNASNVTETNDNRFALSAFNQEDNLQDSFEPSLYGGRIALRKGEFDKAGSIFDTYIAGVEENEKKLAYYRVSAFYTDEYLQIYSNQSVVLAAALTHSQNAVEMVFSKLEKKETPSDLDVRVLNLYAYLNALNNTVPMPEDAVRAAETAVQILPDVAIFDTLALTYFRTGFYGNEKEGAGLYFTIIEKELGLWDQEMEYNSTIAPPYLDESTKIDSNYYVLYAHLSAWNTYLGNDAQADRYQAEMLKLAPNKDIAQKYLEGFRSMALESKEKNKENL